MIGSFGPSSFVVSGPSLIVEGSCASAHFFVEAVDVDRRPVMAMESLAIHVDIDGGRAYLGPNCGGPGVATLLIPSGRSATEFYVRIEGGSEIQMHLSSDSGLVRGDFVAQVRSRTETARTTASELGPVALPLNATLKK
jgi:hypothetical protein